MAKEKSRIRLHGSIDDIQIHRIQTPGKDWILFKMPLGWYHQTDRPLEVVEGEIIYQGSIYEKMIQGIGNDTLLVYCVTNLEQEKVLLDLKAHLNEYVLGNSIPDLHQKHSQNKHSQNKHSQNKRQTGFKFASKQIYLPVSVLELPLQFSRIAQTRLSFALFPTYRSFDKRSTTPPPETFCLG